MQVQAMGTVFPIRSAIPLPFKVRACPRYHTTKERTEVRSPVVPRQTCL
jgi:hypothetical protein